MFFLLPLNRVGLLYNDGCAEKLTICQGSGGQGAGSAGPEGWVSQGPHSYRQAHRHSSGGGGGG